MSRTSLFLLKGFKTATAYNTVILPLFLVFKLCAKAQFPHSFGWITQNYAKIAPFHKMFTLGN